MRYTLICIILVFDIALMAGCCKKNNSNLDYSSDTLYLVYSKRLVKFTGFSKEGSPTTTKYGGTRIVLPCTVKSVVITNDSPSIALENDEIALEANDPVRGFAKKIIVQYDENSGTGLEAAKPDDIYYITLTPKNELVELIREEYWLGVGEGENTGSDPADE